MEDVAYFYRNPVANIERSPDHSPEKVPTESNLALPSTRWQRSRNRLESQREGSNTA